jgi:hypothetical protein
MAQLYAVTVGKGQIAVGMAVGKGRVAVETASACSSSCDSAVAGATPRGSIVCWARRPNNVGVKGVALEMATGGVALL